MTMTGTSEDVTDVDAYFADHPQYVLCRQFGHDFPKESVPLEAAYDDPVATHHRVRACRCGVERRDRYIIEVRGNRVVSYDPLGPRNYYRNAPGYLMHGVRVSRSDVDEMQIRHEIELAAKPVRVRKKVAA